MRKRFLSKQERLLVLQAQRYQCAYCGAKLNLQNFIVDHVIPYSRGGITAITNSAAACAPCNSKKGSRREKAPEVAT
jgi:5-methylcytosine-specific restriction endonuclease McrA